MEEEEYNRIKKEYNNFRKRFSDNIENSSISLNNEVCYLIEENWADNLKQGFNKYKNLKENNELIQDFDYYDLLPQEDPDFINDFSSILEEITNNKKIQCISKKLFELIYDKNNLKDYHYIKYYSGNNKLIIEYENDNKAILLIDPLNQTNLKNNAKIILIEDEKKNKLFKNLLSLPSRNDIPDDYLDYIISIDSYNNKLKNILKLLIYFYYYEKELKNNKEDIFNENDNNYYYLINPEWLNKFKDIFNFSEISQFLKLIDRKTKNINFNNLNNYYEKITSQIDENIINKKIILLDEILNAEQVKLKSDKLYNILYHKSCYIINSQIMSIIKSIFNNSEINIKSRRIKFFNNSIYIFYDKKVIIGKLNGLLLFIPKYIIVYISKDIFISEEQYLFESTIEDYINEFKCDPNNPNLQLLNDNKGNLGKLVVLNAVQSNNKSDNKQKNKSLPKTNFSFNKNNSLNTSNKNVNIRTEINNMSHSIDHYDYEKNNLNKNSSQNVNIISIKNNKSEWSNKIKKYIKINKDENIEKKISNEEQIINNNKDNENNNKKIGNLIKNNYQENYSEEDGKNAYFNNNNEINNNFMNKFNALNQQKLEKEPKKNINENELTY